ncbi:hypothetical protein JTB14_016169 [Gonioctena quinquepunctata]|nr:hypothetical protein JTB14_016169 [Gonioctena quinquepunctata]
MKTILHTVKSFRELYGSDDSDSEDEENEEGSKDVTEEDMEGTQEQQEIGQVIEGQSRATKERVETILIMKTNVWSIQQEFGGEVLLYTENIDLAENQVTLIEPTEVVYDIKVANGTLEEKEYVHIDVSED